MTDPMIIRFEGQGREMVVLPADIYDALLARAAMAPVAVPTEVRTAVAAGASVVAAWRAHRGMSQMALAATAGVSQVWISRIERGGGYGSAAVRARIAAALGIGMVDLG